LKGKIMAKKTTKTATKKTTTRGEYVIIRADRAGVFAGYLERRSGSEVVLRNARRIWYWDGAASLSQLATDGTSAPQNCKFPCTVARITILGVIEVIPATAKAQKSIEGVAIWQR
jgi:hypothetical protein